MRQILVFLLLYEEAVLGKNTLEGIYVMKELYIV